MPSGMAASRGSKDVSGTWSLSFGSAFLSLYWLHYQAGPLQTKSTLTASNPSKKRAFPDLFHQKSWIAGR